MGLQSLGAVLREILVEDRGGKRAEDCRDYVRILRQMILQTAGINDDSPCLVTKKQAFKRRDQTGAVQKASMAGTPYSNIGSISSA